MSACVIPLKQGVDFGRVSGIKSLPPFPAVACKLLSLMSNDDANFRAVSELLTTDTALSGQVLRVANSALFGFRQEVKSILQALCLVGANRVRDVVVTVALRNYIGRDDAEALRTCWRHNLATALWGETLSRWYKLDGPMSYTAGLLHDLGRIALLMLLPTDYASFMDNSATSDMDCRTAERELFDFDHCQIGHYLSRLWNFQPVFTDIIGHHHDELTSETPRSRALAQAACAAASMSGFHAVGPARTWDPERIAALSSQAGKGASPPMDRLLQKVVDELNLIECSLL
jgi:HD-like signal output (HDOD) protein